MKPGTHTASRPHKPLPKFWRPKTAPSAMLTCKIIHWDLITHFTRGTAGAQELWDWIETGFTYSQMMRLLLLDGLEFSDADKLALNAQIEIYDAVIARIMEMHTPAIDAEIARLSALKAQRQRKAQGLRDYLKANMQAAGIQKLESPLFKIALQNNPASVEIYELGLVPAVFMRTPPTPPPAPDKTAIKAALKAGVEVQGARLTASQRLVVT